MLKRIKNVFGIITIMCFMAPVATFAQDVTIEAPVEIKNTAFKKNRIIRKVEPVPYWVDADQLRIRDNPVAGDVIGMLELGQKIKAYEQFENWIRINKSASSAKWVNTDYLTNTPITWARYGNNSVRRTQRRAGLGDDINLTRIKVTGSKSSRIYAASVKKSANGNRVIVTRQSFRSGPYFEKRLVACKGSDATHVQMLGEGYSYMMMENDVRGATVDVNTAMPKLEITVDAVLSPATIAIANFSCEADV